MKSPPIEIEEGEGWLRVIRTYDTHTVNACPHCGEELEDGDMQQQVMVETEDGDVPYSEFEDNQYGRK